MTSCDYETRWRILGRLVISEMRWYDFVLNKNGRNDLYKVMHWMMAIDAGIRDADRLKEMKAEVEKK